MDDVRRNGVVMSKSVENEVILWKPFRRCLRDKQIVQQLLY
jgi:hypothetical protein